MRQYESLKYVNSRGESIVFGIGSKFHVNVQKDVTGISDITNTIYSTGSMGQDGDTLVGNRIEPRDVEITGKIQDPDKDTQLRLRREAVKILNPQLTGTLYYQYGDYIRCCYEQRHEFKGKNPQHCQNKEYPSSGDFAELYV